MVSLLRPLARRPWRYHRQCLAKSRSQWLKVSRHASIPFIEPGQTHKRMYSGIPKINDREQEAFIKVFKKIIEAEKNNPKSLTSDRLNKSQATIEQFPETLKPLVRELEQTVLTERLSVGNETDVGKRKEEQDLDPETKLQLEKSRRMCQEAYERTVQAIEESTTDAQIIEVLERELFVHARIVDQDEIVVNRWRGKPEPKASEAEQRLSEDILSANYSGLLIFALRQLKMNFPDSPVSSTVFSRMRSTGPKSHALAASTSLYNLFIELNWQIYGDIHQILDLLEDMDRQGLDFDQVTAGLVETITQTLDGNSLERKLKTKVSKQKIADTQELFEWRHRILQRMQEAASRRALELAQLQHRQATSVNVH